jgi:predicted AlkP superfamily pyrophosphatase or phosphodiesterase
MRPLRIAAVLLLTLCCASSPLRAQPEEPKLVVVIVVDQMRADYPVRYASLLQHGLKQLTSRGAWYRNASYPYMMTVTCAGHTTIGTGALPYRHGMIQNEWYDRETAKPVTCNADPETTDVSDGTSRGPSGSAKRMMVPTLAETMRGMLKSRVATMSIKSRSAIGLAGHTGDFVVWFGGRAAWGTSSAFSPVLAPWFSTFLKGNPVDGDADKVWKRTLPPARYQYEDDAPGERGIAGWGATFPHPLGRAGDAAYLQHWLQSPFADDYLERIAEAAVDELHLGMQDRTDFLGISFSMLDSIGHAFGPRSQEVQDTLVRLDVTIGKLLEFLDKKVGAGKYVVALTADHGVADMPEQIAGGGRVAIATIRARVEAAVKTALGGEGPFVAAAEGSEIYFAPGVFDRLKSSPAALRAAVAAAGAVPGVGRILTSDQVSRSRARASKDPQIRAAALSYFPGRSGDLLIIQKDNWILAPTGTTHGSLYPYDQRVPLILYGAGIRTGVRTEAATPADLAPTLASLIDLRLPSTDGRILTGALQR